MTERIVNLTTDMQRVTLQLGDVLRLCLVETPTTGYLWSRVGPLPAEMNEHGVEFHPASDAIGGGGRRCFIYSCQQHFVGDLVFELRRPWLPDKVEKTVRVTVKCAG